ncbi:MAG: type IV toxin-antitoxin system AbiEi family antitoxin domain-containing protein [bacterium]
MQNEYNKQKIPGGITKANRKLLDLLHRQQRGPFTPQDAMKILEISYTKSTRLLAYWTERGWLTRIRKGLYMTVPLGSINPSERREDPWIIAASIFKPCYIGGWSACEHWGLTEQIFKDVVVITANKIRKRELSIQGTPFILKAVQEKKIFGTKIVWREHTKVKVSDPSRTLVDILDDPSIGGGVRHIAEIINQYFEGEHKDTAKLLEYIKTLNNRTIYKRLGFIIETLNLNYPDLIERCQANLSKGYSVLDPTAASKGNIVRRWNLKVNVRI